MARDTQNDFVNNIEELLKSDNTFAALKVFSDSKNVSEIKNNSWELIPVLSMFLTGNYEQNKPEVFWCSEKLMHTVASLSNPEEVLLQLIEEIEECCDDTKFVVLLKPLQRIILRIPTKRINSLAWGFNSIKTFLNKHEVPDNVKLVGKEKLLLDSNDQVHRITHIFHDLLSFYDGIISNLPSDEAESKEYKSLVCKFLVELLGKPLVYLDMEIFNHIKCKARIVAENIVERILKVNCDPISLLELKSDMKNSELITPNTLSLSSLFYLIFHEHILIEQVPKVYDPLYLFHFSLHLVNTLLDSDHHITVEKGLKLSNSLQNHVKYFKLPYLMLDSGHHSQFCKSLAKIIIYNELEVLRILALEIYKKYITSFDLQGFYLLIYNLMSALNHSGLIGYTITIYKDNLAYNFPINKDPVPTQFKGQKLLMLLKKFCFLHKKEESDLIELSDQIIAALNLLRFLALRDKENVTEIWDHFKQLEKIYFIPLRKAIDLSRAHYELKIKEVREDCGGKKDLSTEMSIMIGGQNLNEMDKNEKLKVLGFSLTVFDMLESLLTRLLECIEHHYN